MSDFKKNAPELRFKGFVDAWEQRKLNRLVTPVVREVPKPDEAYERISVRSHAKGTFHQKVDDPKAVSMDKLYVVKENDLIVNITFAWEHAIAVASKKDDGLLVSHRFPTFIIDNSDINFIHYSVTQESFRKKMELISPGGAGRNRVLNKKDFVNLKIDVPIQIEEQSKIGKFLKQLDDTIALYQDKKEKLEIFKKAHLDLIFSQIIRFRGYKEKWEHHKLVEVVDVRSGRDYKHLTEGIIPVYGTGGYMLSVNEALSYKEDAIGIGRKGTIDKPFILKAPFWTVDTLFYAVPRKKYDLDFTYYIFQRIDWKKKDESTGVPSLSKTTINNIDVLFPNYNEQKVIGRFFRELDNLITLYDKKMTKLKELKKAYLHKMFV
jgi:type I restriction enzyme, S subunit